MQRVLSCETGERPFFLFVSHKAPHTPLQGRDPAQKKSKPDKYKEMIEVLDESVGTICAALRDHQLEKNTLVIFCSDNGPQLELLSAAGPLKGKKGDMYEGGHRVPFIAFWPGVIPSGSTSDERLMTMDFLPTFTKLAGVKPPGDLKIDGMNMMPVLKGETKEVDRTLYWLFGDSWAVRKGPWKLIGKKERHITLVNLEEDIGEKHNRLMDYPERVKEFARLHKDWIEEVGDR